MTATPKRMSGPALLSAAAATVYTAPTGTGVTAIIRFLHFSNPSTSDQTVTLTIGADAAGTRLFQTYTIPSGTVFPLPVYFPLTTGEIVQAYAGNANQINLTLAGEEIT